MTNRLPASQHTADTFRLSLAKCLVGPVAVRTASHGGLDTGLESAPQVLRILPEKMVDVTRVKVQDFAQATETSVDYRKTQTLGEPCLVVDTPRIPASLSVVKSATTNFDLRISARISSSTLPRNSLRSMRTGS